MKVAVVVGHDKGSTGKYSDFLKKSEFEYNSEVASYLSFYNTYFRNGKGSYKQQMKALADELNPKNYDLVLELHFNAFNGKAQGVEVVGWKGSTKGKEWSDKFTKAISEKYEIRDRGFKITEPGGRGYWFTYYITTTTLILEPFFGDQEDCIKFKNIKDYACDIQRWVETLTNNS